MYCHQLCLIQQVSWVSKTFLEKAPCHAGQEVPETAQVLYSHPYPWPFLLFLPNFPPPGQLLCLPGKNRLHHLSGSEPTLSPLAAPASPSAQADRHRAALIRCLGDCGARDAPAPRGARRLVQPQSVCSRGHREQRCSRGTDASVLAQRPRGQQRRAPKARTMQATADSTKMDCVWSNWKSQGILFISVVHACGARERRDPDSAIVHHFTCGTYACFIPKSFLMGGVNLFCQKSKWMMFDFCGVFPLSCLF